MINIDWRERAIQLLQTKSIRKTTDILQEECFPFDKWETVRSRVKRINKRQQREEEQSSREYQNDGSIVSEKFITLRDGDELTPDQILEIHGFNPSAWEVISCRNNFWNTQIKGGAKQISYQSRLTAKPKAKGIDLAEIDRHFAKLDRKHFTPPIIKSRQGSLMAEINIADLHLGKLCWHGDTPENFDYKIAREAYYRIIGEIGEQLKGKPIDYITFVWANDFFNSDTVEKTTTGGTPQDTDIREKKLFNIGVEMLVRGVEMLEDIAPIKTFYTPSNHDELSGYHALKYLEAWFRQDDNVTVDTGAYPRKYQLYGNTLIGYCHGDKENGNGSKEKASRLASLMPNEARELWGQAMYHEMHVAHLHSEQMIQEINGVIVRRISSPTASDTWHTESGYLGAVRKAQTFLYDKERGLMQVINTPVG